jgi:predicted RNA-binding Zn-ribbon protein involved in translation (DUF1610 family)
MWEIDHQCPQCGAPVIIEETDVLFSCPYCKVKLLMAGHDAVSYYLGEPAPDGETLFLPYRRNTGVDIRCTSTEITSSLVDKTSLASSLPFLPRSLGVRTQALRLKFLTKETKGRFVIPNGAAEDHHLAESRQAILPGYAAAGLTASAAIRRFLSRASSFIYNPFRLLDDDVYDAISAEIVGRFDANHTLDGLSFGQPPVHLAFIPAACPNCGTDLNGDKESVALPCRNCGILWEATETGLVERPFLSLPHRSGETTYLPFWWIRAAVKGIDEALYTDPFKSIPPRSAGRLIAFDDFRFLIPAFFLNPVLFLRLSERATLWQPAKEEVNNEADHDTWLYPVTLSACQAAKLLPIILSSVITRTENALVSVVRGSLEPAQTTILFIPFTRTAAELLHEEMKVGLLRTAFRHET